MSSRVSGWWWWDCTVSNLPGPGTRNYHMSHSSNVTLITCYTHWHCTALHWWALRNQIIWSGNFPLNPPPFFIYFSFSMCFICPIMVSNWGSKITSSKLWKMILDKIESWDRAWRCDVWCCDVWHVMGRCHKVSWCHVTLALAVSRCSSLFSFSITNKANHRFFCKPTEHPLSSDWPK